MKARIDVVELFPVYVQTAAEDFGLEVDVPEELIKELEETVEKFSDVQYRLREAYDKAYKAKHGKDW
jgi:hypothetical protein